MSCKYFVYVILFIQVTFAHFIESIDVHYPEEREALLQLRDLMHSDSNLHTEWTGPPCYYNQSRWAGVGCDNWHVTRLVLEGIGLTGSLPPSFLLNITYLTKLSLSNNSISGDLPNLTDLVHLEYVLLSGNNLSGSIPLHYIDLPKLKELELQENELGGVIPPFDQQSLTDFNLSYNHLSGSIPETSILERFPKSSYDHNLGLCGRPLSIPCPVSPPFTPNTTTPPPGSSPSTEEGRLKICYIVLIAAAAAVIPISVILIFLCYYRRVYRKENKPENPASM